MRFKHLRRSKLVFFRPEKIYFSHLIYCNNQISFFLDNHNTNLVTFNYLLPFPHNINIKLVTLISSSYNHLYKK